MGDKYLLGLLEDKLVDTVSSYLQNNGLREREYHIVFSGGFDSSLLAALTKPMMGYRIKFPYGSMFDESRYAEAVAKHLNLFVNEIVITPELFRENFEGAVRVMGEPTTHLSLVPLYILMMKMVQDGVKDVLSGEGPDEYLGGYARQIIFDELKKLYEIPELRNYHGMVDRELGIPIQNKDRALLRKYYDLIYGGDDKTFSEFCNDKLGNYPLQGQIGKMDMELGHIEKMEQRFAKHFGINFHYPYINKELAEFCYKLPDHLKIRNGVTKWGFKKIAMKYSPEIMRDRQKMGGPVAPVNELMGWTDLDKFDKSRYLEEQKKILGL